MIECDPCVRDSCRWYVQRLCFGKYRAGERPPCIQSEVEQKTILDMVSVIGTNDACVAALVFTETG